MRDHLEEAEVRQHVEALCKTLHKEDSANIWLFLSHHSKNPVLVELILAHAKTLFKDTSVPKFEEDLGFFKIISDSIPSIVLVNRSPEELRELRRRELDVVHKEEKEISDEEYEHNDFMRLVAQLIYLFPTDYKTKQQICEELEIPIKQVRGIDATSESQKRLPGPRKN
jgi:hypothetical protein